MTQKIFQIGFNKCGTVSLWVLFKHYCKPLIPCIHWDDGKLALSIEANLNHHKPLLSGYEDYVFFSDMEAVYYENNYPKIIEAYKYYQVLDHQYPNSKFILNTRNIDNWILSRINFKTYLLKYEEDSLKKYIEDYEYILYYMDKYDTSRIDDIASMWRNDYYRHVHNVKKYFTNRENDFLEFNVETDSLDKLQNFVIDNGLIFTTDKLPHLNETKTKESS